MKNVFELLFQKISFRKLYFPMEGHLWERSLCIASRKFNFKTYGFIHALNITTSANNKLIYISKFSPNYVIAQNMGAKVTLIKKSWPSKLILLRSINQDNILILRNLNKLQTKENHNILLLGSFMRTEDEAALKYCYKIFKDKKEFTVFYKPHPLIAKNATFHLKKSIGSLSNVEIIKTFKNEKFNIVLSPLSSTSSIQLNSNKNCRLLLYSNPKFHCPNPLDQFGIKLKFVDKDKNYLIQEKKNIKDLLS